MLDSDTCHFNRIYSGYERSCRAKGCAVVMSTGYEFSSDPEDYRGMSSAPLAMLQQIRLASVVDIAIRIVTAVHIVRGVYYPEPNTRVLIPESLTILSGAFLDMQTEVDEESSVILRCFVEHIKNPEFRFIDDRPLITTLSARSFKR